MITFGLYFGLVVLVFCAYCAYQRHRWGQSTDSVMQARLRGLLIRVDTARLLGEPVSVWMLNTRTSSENTVPLRVIQAIGRELENHLTGIRPPGAIRTLYDHEDRQFKLLDLTVRSIAASKSSLLYQKIPRYTIALKLEETSDPKRGPIALSATDKAINLLTH